MKKESDRTLGKTPSQKGGEQHQVVIVYPDNVVGIRRLENLPEKFLVNFFIRFPFGLVIGAITGKVMKERPKGSVGKSVVILADFIGVDKYRMTLVLIDQCLFDVPLFAVVGRPISGPPYKIHIPSLLERTQSRSQSSRTLLNFQSIFSLGYSHWKPVGHQNDLSLGFMDLLHG
jgi:hypothetical protein